MDKTLRTTAAAATALLLSALGPGGAAAATLYKLVDRNGAVTYADAIPERFDGVIVPLDLPAAAAFPPPAAPRLSFRGEATDEEIIRRRPDTSFEDRIDAARERAAQARQALDAAHANATGEDYLWFGPGNPLGMRRAPRPEFQARLQQLEGDVIEAEARLADLEAAR